jgi:hypothetical protein
MAADLADYPEPFVSDGIWADSVIVVGEKAKTSDVLGAIEIAASLQAAAYSLQAVEIEGVTESTATAGVKIEKAGNEFNIGDDIQNIDSSFGDEDLPDILADGTYSESKGENDNDEDFLRH